MNKAHEYKQNKYAGLLSDLNKGGVKTSLVCFEVGSRGLVSRDNISRIRSVFKFTKATINKQAINDISRLALLTSYAIWNCRKEPVWDDIAIMKLNRT